MLNKEENILLNAEKLFAEKGFEGTSTREIAKAANVNVSMISYYFGSKEKLFEAIFQFRVEEGQSFANNVLENNALNAWEKFSVIVERYVDRLKTYRDFYLMMQREQLSGENPVIQDFLRQVKTKFFRLYQRVVEQGLNEGIFTKMPEMDFLHSTISGTLHNAMNATPVYKNLMEGDENYEQEYIPRLKNHIKNILKYLLGYDEK